MCLLIQISLRYKQKIETSIFPKHLSHLEFGECFNQELINLPKSVTHLVLCKELKINKTLIFLLIRNHQADSINSSSKCVQYINGSFDSKIIMDHISINIIISEELNKKVFNPIRINRICYYGNFDFYNYIEMMAK